MNWETKAGTTIRHLRRPRSDASWCGIDEVFGQWLPLDTSVPYRTCGECSETEEFLKREASRG